MASQFHVTLCNTKSKVLPPTNLVFSLNACSVLSKQVPVYKYKDAKLSVKG